MDTPHTHAPPTHILQVGTNGIISFDTPFYSHMSVQFPGATTDISSAYLIAPFWDDFDIRREGNIYYEIHSTNSSSESALLIDRVSEFISNRSGADFNGNWMLVTQWNATPPFPNGNPQLDFSFFFLYPDLFSVS